jgi:hypothetical protein
MHASVAAQIPAAAYVYDNWAANLTVVAATLISVVLVVLTHYEGLVVVSRRLQRMHGHQRVKVLYAIVTLLALHVCEIWIFGLIFWLLTFDPACGHIASGALATPESGFLDAIYHSATTYTTIGFGDLVPVGPIRFLSGTEALTGLMMIAWSASFTYLEMERFWRHP